jgi:hypothetical protein
VYKRFDYLIGYNSGSWPLPIHENGKAYVILALSVNGKTLAIRLLNGQLWSKVV